MSHRYAEQLTLGRLIRLLEVEDQQKYIQYDFVNFVPTTLDSYRGYYTDLAIGFKQIDDLKHNPTVGSLLADLKSAVGQEYTGWKGGEFTMNESTPLWVDKPGGASGTAIVGVIGDEYRVILVTRMV